MSGDMADLISVEGLDPYWGEDADEDEDDAYYRDADTSDQDIEEGYLR